DLTSGSSHTYAANSAVAGSWKVQVNLTGDGSGTPVILDIVITTTSPPSVTTNSASAITCSSAVLNGNLTGLGTSTDITVGFLFGLSPTLSGATNQTVSVVNATGTFSFNATGLSEGTFYYFRAWANGTDGYAQGAILYFQTQACPTICGPDPYSSSNLWSLGFLIGVAVVLSIMGG